MQPPEADHLLDAFARLARGVAVVSVREQDGFRGVTATSVTSLSLSPPLLLFCFDLASQSLQLIREHRRIAASLLAREHEFLADRFSARAPLVDRTWREVPHAPAPSGLPIVQGSIGWFDCTVEELYPGGDHEIVVASIQAVGSGPGDPLVLFDRDYWSVG